jgi:hypothetical protein
MALPHILDGVLREAGTGICKLGLSGSDIEKKKKLIFFNGTYFV